MAFTARAPLSLACTLLVGRDIQSTDQSSPTSINQPTKQTIDTHSLSLSLSILDDHHHHTLNRDLNNNLLSGTIPSSIGSLVNLQYLYAQSNTRHSQTLILQSITNINHLNNQSILTLSISLSLSILDDHHRTLNRNLSFNQVNGTIPSSIGSLVNLSYLYAQSNT